MIELVGVLAGLSVVAAAYVVGQIDNALSTADRVIGLGLGIASGVVMTTLVLRYLRVALKDERSMRVEDRSEAELKEHRLQADADAREKRLRDEMDAREHRLQAEMSALRAEHADLRAEHHRLSDEHAACLATTDDLQRQLAVVRRQMAEAIEADRPAGTTHTRADDPPEHC